jgi:hypothetical protein
MIFTAVTLNAVGVILEHSLIKSSIIEIPNDESRAVFVPWKHVSTLQRVGNRAQLKTVHGSGFDFESKLFDEIFEGYCEWLSNQELETLELDV